MPARVVPGDCCFGVVERMAADGRAITPLDENSVGLVVAELRARGVTSVAVCLLHSYKFPEHERKVGALLAAAGPELSVSLSSDVCPEIREYDRASTTVVNAYTRPLMTQHVERLEADLRKDGIVSRMLWMTSSGGVVPSATASRTPVRLIESGPAAGAGPRPGYAPPGEGGGGMFLRLGGPTAKPCLVADGQADVGGDPWITPPQRLP